MVALLLVQPALGQEFVRVWKHSRIPRCCKVAEGDQSLRGDRGRGSAPTFRYRCMVFLKHTHVFRNEVASDLNVSLCDYSGIGGDNRVQPGEEFLCF